MIRESFIMLFMQKCKLRLGTLEASLSEMKHSNIIK